MYLFLFSVQVVIPTNESTCIQDSLSQIDNDQIDSGGNSSEFIELKEESIIEIIPTDNNKLIDEISETIVVTNDIYEETIESTNIAVESINSSEYCPDSTAHSSTEPCKFSENCLEEKSESVTEIVSSGIVEVMSSDVDTPIALIEKIQDVEPELIKTVTIESNTSEVIVEENVSTVDISVTADDVLEESHKNDINDLEQMEDVVQLTVESPDLVDDEEEPKSINKKKHKSVDEELQSVDEDKPKLVDLDKLNDKSKSILDVEEKNNQIEVSCPITSEIPNLKLVDVENDIKLDEIPKILHPKRKWGSCKTRTLITISPFTLGTIIESNDNSIGDNGEYRSEGEIQRTDSEDNEYEDVDEAMDVNDTMLIDHEAVDYEAPDEEEKPDNDNDNDDSKSDKSLPEVINEIKPKKKSAKRVMTTNVIRITNLVRPFTVGQLRDLLQRTGKIVANGFWIDSIKSQCIVEYENEDQAIETVYALNESQWPSTNPKVLRVVFTDKEELNKALNGTHTVRSDKQKESKVEKLRTQLDNHIILREWDRGKLEDMNGEKEDKVAKRKISDDPYVIKDKRIKNNEKDLLEKRKKSKSKTPERIPTKSLDELFRKTKTTPTLYWSPLSTEQITEKEDQRRKHLAEMERSQKTDRRRRDINHYPRRR